jgi:flagellar motility protein MotE (MotC chaperone)
VTAPAGHEGQQVDVQTIEALREQHPAWRLLRAQHAALVLSFLGAEFVEGNAGAIPANRLVEALEDHLEALNAGADEPPYPRSAEAYLESWAADDSGWLRRFYPASSDEVHYEATPALEKAYGWVAGLPTRSFVGTESRLHAVVDLLRQMVHGTESDADARLALLRAQRDELDRQITEAEAGNVPVLSDTAVRERYQLFASTARELLSDFRQVEENFRSLDRGARERIAAWEGSKGELLAELVAGRADISSSDQGSSFQAFYDFLLSEARQDELAELLRRVQSLEPVQADRRLRTVHHDWAEAAERTQQTVRQVSEQLRRFLDDQVWLENRRVLELVRSIEAAALACRESPPDTGLTVDVPGLSIALPFERPLYDARPAARVESMLAPVEEEQLDVSTLFHQTFVDQARLADNIRAVLPERSSTLLTDILEFYPVEHGAAEILGYLSLTEEDLDVSVDETDEIVVDYVAAEGRRRRARLPKVTVSRR